MAAFEMYKDKAGEFRWRFVSDNGNTMATSGQGYANKRDCENGIKVIKKDAPKAPIKDKT